MGTRTRRAGRLAWALVALVAGGCGSSSGADGGGPPDGAVSDGSANFDGFDARANPDVAGATDGGGTSDAIPPRDGGSPVDAGGDGGVGSDAAGSDTGVPDYFTADDVPQSTRDMLDGRILSATIPTEHPRLFGVDAVWRPRVDAFEQLDPACSFTGSANPLGDAANVRAMWWNQVYGSDRCSSAGVTPFASGSDAAFYVSTNPTVSNIDAHHDRQLRTLFLIRDQLSCHRAGRTDCIYSTTDLDRLITAFVSFEMTRLRGLATGPCGYVREWHRTSHLFMDINSPVGFRFFNLLLDTLDGNPAFSAADRAYVEGLLTAEIDSYLCSLEGPSSPACGNTFQLPCSRPMWNGTVGSPAQYPDCHWSICGGNNWTPQLNMSALYWVIQHHDTDPDRAGRVLRGLLATNWLHRKQILADGTYTEGSSYVEESFQPSREMNALMRATFNEPLDSYRWGALDPMGTWLVESMTPDGRSADFGDAWDGRGFSAMTPLESSAWRELIGLAPAGSTAIDPCLVRRYFENIYYDHAFDNPWVLEPALARDWASISAACPALVPESLSIYRDQVEAISSLTVSGATALAAMGTRPLYEQADRVWLGMAGSPNDFPHREADFGALIWTAFGTRLLYDFGYGQIFHFDNDEYWHLTGSGYMNFMDYALGSNELIVDEAATPPSSYHAQFLGEHGTMERRTFGRIEVARADGSAVYGSTHPDGWLQVMHRWIFAHDAGVHVVVDAYRALGDRPLTVEELFYTSAAESTDCSVAGDADAVTVALPDAHTVDLTPRCSDLLRAGSGYAAAESRGRILAASRAGGSFAHSLPPFLTANTAFMTANVVNGVVRFPLRTGGTILRDPFRYAPTGPTASDVRVFVLVPGTQTAGLPSASVTPVACAGGACFDVQVGARVVHVTVDDATSELSLAE